MAYIYKILNKITKKCYIGETISKNVNWRWNQHKQKYKENKGCPALRDAFKKYGLDNFEFSILIICFDDDRFNYEIDYIRKYNSIVPNGYNITKGGEGGGFHGKNHTKEIKENIKKKLKQKYIDNPYLVTQISEKNKLLMNNPNIKEKIKSGIAKSEKMKKAIDEKRIGNYKKIKPNEETKKKISESLIKYHSENICKKNNIGIKIQQYDLNNLLLNEFESIRSASNKSSVPRTTISCHLKDKTKTGGGFIWKII